MAIHKKELEVAALENGYRSYSFKPTVQSRFTPRIRTSKQKYYYRK